MIVYQESCETFMADVRESNIDFVIHNQFQQKLNHRTSESEVNSWKNSMQYMKNVLEVAEVPRDAMVTIECQIPQTSKRIDFILTGLDEKKQSNAVIIELKQWSEAESTTKDAVVRTFVGGGTREVSHPSYQAWSYADLLTNFNRSVEKTKFNSPLAPSCTTAKTAPPSPCPSIKPISTKRPFSSSAMCDCWPILFENL